MSGEKYTTVKWQVPIPRTCESCNHAYTVPREFHGNASGHGLEPMAKATAAAFAEGAKYGTAAIDRFGVLCPSCRRFSPGAMRKYFPTGYVDGLVAQSRSFWMTLGCVAWVFGGLLTLIGMGLTVYFVTANTGDPPGIGVLIAIAGLGFAALPFIPLSRLKMWHGELDAMPDEDVYAIVVATYRKNGSDVSMLVNWTEVLKDVQRNPDNYTGVDYLPPDEPDAPDAETRLQVRCPKCKEPQAVLASARGTTVVCLSCQARIKIPAPKP